MPISLVPLLAASALVGVLHMSAPDHWVTLVIMGRSAGWSERRLVGVSFVAGLGHVVLSILLGFAVVVLGLVFSQILSFYVTEFVGFLMLVVGLGYAIKSLYLRKTEDYEKEAEDELKTLKKGVGYFAVLGAVLSPDLSILPIFLVAVPVGLSFAVDTAAVFAVASLVTILLLVIVGSRGLANAFEKVPEKYNDSLVGFVIALVGLYVLLFG
ncbi:MAG: hypothetical protein OK422_01355 [Thaumarchaeota archaeon]|nr:hypothetical protein [Nitrososphaerota archaeon]